MIEYIRSLKWTDYFFFCLVEPRRLVNLISRKEGSPFLFGLFIVAVVSLFEIISFSMLGTETKFFYYKISYGWIFIFLTVFFKIVVFSSLIGMFCQLRNHQSNIIQLISLINFSFFPLVFLLPCVIIFTTLNFAPVFFYIFFSLLLHVWQAIIIVQGISEIHQIGFGESLVIFMLPFVFTGVIFFFLMILFVVNIAGFISAL